MAKRAYSMPRTEFLKATTLTSTPALTGGQVALVANTRLQVLGSVFP